MLLSQWPVCFSCLGFGRLAVHCLQVGLLLWRLLSGWHWERWCWLVGGTGRLQHQASEAALAARAS